MVLDLSTDALLLAGLIFFLRILNTGIGTVRLVIVTRQQRCSRRSWLFSKRCCSPSRSPASRPT